jgi:amino acid adenylation domain-containing protein
LTNPLPPPNTNSLVDLLELRARQDDGKGAFTFLSDEGKVDQRITYRELDVKARLLAARIMDAAAPGERVLLLYPPGLEFFPAFFGCLYASVIAVPAYPPHRNRNLFRLQSILRDAQPRLVLTTAALLPKIKNSLSIPGYGREIDVIATDELGARESGGFTRPEISQNTIAFLQYTSGSTGSPKGVMLTHGNLLHNASLVNEAVGPVPEDSYVSWLPVFHDMGFMAGVLQPLFRGLPSFLMAPAAFLEKPVRWLQAISHYKATASGGPSFAYELCVRRIAKADLAGIDLSSWTVAFNGSEPVRADVMERFASAFASCGFRRNAFYPCYGLAEATLMVSGSHKGQRVMITQFDGRELESHRVCLPRGNVKVQTLVGCGRNLPGQEIAIVDPESHDRCAPDHVGEIWVRGASVAAGYWNNTDLSRETFDAHVNGTGAPFLRTGDLGFLGDEQLFITGRIKDLLIIRGQNHYPQDIELTVEHCDPVLQPGSGAAFSVDAGDEEHLVVVQEAVAGARNDWERVFASIRRAIAENHELAPHAIVLIRTGTIQKTSSGKIQRRACKDAFLAGQLRVLAAWYAKEHEHADLVETEPASVDQPIHSSPLATRLIQEIARKAGVASETIELDQPLTAYGLDSLAAIELVHRLQVEFGLHLKMADLFDALTLGDILRKAEEADPSEVVLGPQTSGLQPYPLAHGQRAIWFLQQMAPHSSAYNIARAVRVTSKLEVDPLQRSFQALVDRHPALRTTFIAGQGEPAQQVHPEAEAHFECLDASSWSEARLTDELVAHSRRAFDLVKGPLFRTYLYTRSEGNHVLQLVVHHLVADFWSLTVLLSDLGQFYRARTDMSSPALPASEYGYTDFVFWQDRLVSGTEGEKLWSYWEQALAGEVGSLNLPCDRTRPPESSFPGATLDFVIDPTLTAKLKALASGSQTTLFMVLLAAYQVLLYRLTAQSRFAVGVPTSGRSRAEFSDLAGYFVNVLPLIADFTKLRTFADFLTDVRRRTLDSFAHDSYPFPMMVERLGIPRSFNLPPVFQTMFVFHKAYGRQSPDFVALAMSEPGARLNVGGLELEVFPTPEHSTQFDLMLTMGEGKASLRGTWQYSTDLFDRATLFRWNQSFLELLRGIAANPECPIHNLPVIPENEHARLLHEFNQTRLEVDPWVPLHDQISRQAMLQPGRTAVAWGGERLSYRDLNARADQVACYLQRQGAGPEDRVAVCLRRTPNMIIAMLGVWKAGAAYVPLDPQYPHERLRFMLQDARAKFVLTEDTVCARVDGTSARVVDLNELTESTLEDSPADPGPFSLDQLAYVIYTSGSTGTPKGVMLTHQSVFSFVAWARNNFSAEELSGVLAGTSICFDLSIFELWATLSAGGTVILAENILEWSETGAGPDAQPSVRLINTVPSAMEGLLQRRLPESVSTINLAGEALHESLVRKIFATGAVQRVNNLYGPTETTTYSSWTRVTAEDLVTIGRGIGNTQLYVLDGHFQLAPIGVVGELYIGGAGVARGYWQRPDWTGERFVPNPYSRIPGERIFRTGDLVRWRPDGQLLYLGRTDQQIKIRGFRIELGEISAILGQWPALRESAVVAIEDAENKHLVAYIVPGADAELTSESVREYLRQYLPEYMVPNHIVLLSDLPKTSSGKVDRRALPAPQHLSGPIGRKPASEAERQVAAVWQEVLKVEQVSADHDFFLLGGHSLLMMQLKVRLEARLNRTVSLAQLLQSPTVAGMAKAIELTGHERHLPPLAQTPQQGLLELSFAQERIWFLEQMNPGLPVYNVAGAVRLKGNLNKHALRKSLQQIVQRHAVLRTAIVVAEGTPRQQVHEAVQFEFSETDLQTASRGLDIEDVLQSNLEAEAKRAFDYHRPGLIRAGLFQAGDDDCTLIVVLHHIVADGWSIGVLLREVEELYRAHSEGTPSALPPLNIQFADYAAWQRNLLRSGHMDEGLAYWKHQLSGAPPVLDLPVDTPRPAHPGSRGGVISFVLGKGLSESIRELCHRQRITPYVLLLGSFQVLLSRYSGLADIIVGTPVADRQQLECEKLIGLLANLVPVRTRVDGDESFASLLKQLSHTVNQAQAWQYIPFEKVVEQVEANRAAPMPLVQVVFAWQVGLMGSLGLGDIVAQPLIVHTGTAKFDLMLTIDEGQDVGLTAWIEYNAEIFDEKTIRQIAARYLRLTEQAVSDPDRRTGDFSLLDEQERKRILTRWKGESFQPRPGCAHSWFEEQAQRRPDAIAVVAGERRLNYRDLNALANQVAHGLIARGVAPEMIVGICCERSEWMIIAILAVLKAGAAYLPLEQEYPPERLAYMLTDARAGFILAEEAMVERLPVNEVPVLLLDRDRELWQKASTENPGSLAQEANVAYVIYTSGSTGQPKGVMVQHGNLTGLLSAADVYFGFLPDDRWTLFHLYSFDFSVWEIWGALAYGGALVIVPPAVRRSPREFYQLLRQENISILSQVPSAFYQLLDYEEQAGAAPDLRLRAVVFGGEALDVKRLESWATRHGEHGPMLVNMYGITETTIHVTYRHLRANDLAAGRSVIGLPLPGYRAWLLDSRQMLLPPGIPGEIYVGGTGVTRGYLYRPELTAQRFVPDPFGREPGARLYRSGDRGRYFEDGTIEYLGRLDHQVKIRGYRIELGEIESVLQRHGAIDDCVVLVKPEVAGDHRLVAYIVAASSEALRPAELRAFLKSELPDYMVPAHFVFLDRLPLTPNGKIDRKHLLQLEASSGDEGSASPILDPTEELIAGIWSSLLGVTELSPRSNFFDLGGHSLVATQMSLRLRHVFGCDVALRSLFEFPVLGALATHIKKLVEAPDSGLAAPIARRNDDRKPLLSSGQQRLWFLDQFAASSDAYNIAGAARLKGELNCEALRQAFEFVIRRHQVLHTGFVEQQGRPQLIQAEVRFDLEMRDFRGQAGREARLAEELREESAREFVLSHPPLLRAVLFRMADQEHVLMVAMHHIIADAWSIDVMIRELSQFYASHHHGAELPFQYADYAAWEHDRWANGGYLTGLEYWRKQLADAPQLELSTAFSGEATSNYRGHMLRTVLDTSLSQQLKELGRRENVTLFMLLLAGFQALLSQYTGEEDVVVGTSMANRNHAGAEGLIGLFTNEVVLRTRLHGDPSFCELLSRVREVTLSAHTHQDVPFGKLVEVLQPQRDFSRNPFFQATVLLNHDPLPQMKFGDLTLEPLELEIDTAIFDVSLVFTPAADGRIRVALRYSARFEAERMKRFLQDLVTVFSFVVEKPESRLSELRSVVAAIDTQAGALAMQAGLRWDEFLVADNNIPHLFEQQVLAAPENIAVRYEGRYLTFAELNEKANRVANHLLALGVRQENFAALCLERSVEILVAILGILKAGAAYVPLDRTYPEQRLKYILEETAAVAILTQHSLAGLFARTSCNVVCIDDESLSDSSPENPALTIHSDNLAYAIYTSGSTGTPKGVMVQHRSVLNLLEGLEQTVYSGMKASTCVSMNAPVVFDASVKQWVRMLKGNTVCILPEEKRFDPEALVAYVSEKNIDVLDCTPSVLRLMLTEGAMWTAGVAPQAVLIGGEAIDTPTWGYLREREEIEFYNVYGPTECTVDVTVCRVSRSSHVSIGHPINNVRAYILNAGLQPLPPGEMGELYVAGLGLARGYCRRPDLTAERFIPDPISGVPGSRLYRTGDLARFLPGGRLEFCGRRDDQVKIRGYRVELEEITAVLCRINDVRDGVVLMTEANSGQSRLMAFVVPEAGTVLNPEQLRDELRRHVPEYMTPSGFVILERLPVTINGKIDRKALVLLSEGQHPPSSTYAPARNRMEEVVAAVWQEVLGLREAGIHDNFFDMGGHSLAMVQVRSRLREVLNKEVPMVELFRNPTIALLSRYLQDGQSRAPSWQLAESRAGKRIAAAKRAGRY